MIKDADHKTKVNNKMSDGLDDVNEMLTRRKALKTGAGALAALAGCTGNNNQETTAITSQQTSQDQNTAETTQQTTEEKDSGLTFNNIYQNSIGEDTGLEPLTSGQLNRAKEKEGPEQFESVLNSLAGIQQYSSSEKGWKRASKHIRAAFLNELEKGPDQTRTNVMRTGGNNAFLVHKFKDEVDGEEIVRKMTGFVPHDEIMSLYVPWQDDEDFGEYSAETYQRGVWEDEDLTMGSAMAIDTYRAGALRGETFEEYVIENDNPGTWLSASRALDGQNDFAVYDPEWKERSEWGEIGYGREASNIIHDFMHLHENQDFTPEWEMEKALTEVYHNEAVGETDTFIHVDVTESGLEDDQTRLTEVDGQVLYAETCDFEQHKKDAYEIAIPDQFWEEGHRYPEGLELPEDKDDGRPAMVDPEVSSLQVDPRTPGNQAWTQGAP